MKTNLKSQNPNYYQDFGDFLPILEKLLTDLKEMCGFVSKADHIRDLETLKRRVKAEGIGFVAAVLPGLAAGLLEYLETGTATYTGFSLCKEGYPRFLKGYFSVAYDIVATTHHVNAVKAIYTFSLAFSKLRMPLNTEDDGKLYRSLVETDRSLPKLRDVLRDTDLRNILGLAAYYATGFAKSFSFDTCTPRPGPGATNTPCEKNMRFQPHVFYDQHEMGGMHYFDWFFINQHDPFMRAEVYTPLWSSSSVTPTARFKTVPKKYKKGRGICIEENESQWLQQALASGLKKAIKSDPELNVNLSLDDQQVNAYLAHLHSLDRDGATIDMSEASNRVAHWLPLVIFSSNVELCNALWGASTRWVDPPDDLFQTGHSGIRLNMFAPMGSGLCFPVMTLVHYYLIKAIIKWHHDSECDSIFVYGDDIVIPSKYYETVTSVLPSFGMKLNLSKSFYRSFFRESCGIHAYMGVDITPVYFKHTPSCARKDAFLSNVAVEAQLFERGYNGCAAYMRTAIRRHWKHPMAEVDKDTSLLGWRRPRSDFGYKVYPKVWDRDLQCWKWRLPLLQAKRTRLRLKPYEAYVRWHVLRPTEGSDSVHTTEDDVRIVFRWIPECQLRRIDRKVVSDRLCQVYGTTDRWALP